VYINDIIIDKCARAAFAAENKLDFGQSMGDYDSRPSYLKNLYIIATRAAIEEYRKLTDD
jgi:hypothetical protein